MTTRAGATRAEAVHRLERIREEINALLDEALDVLRGGVTREGEPSPGAGGSWVRTTRTGIEFHWAPTLGPWVTIPKD